MYFRFLPDCHLVEGVGGGAIYDVGRQRLLILDESMHAFAAQCADSVCIEDLPPQAAKVATLLCECGYGELTSAAVFADKMWLHKPPASIFQPKKLRRIDLAITDECALSCSFCPRKAGEQSVRACLTCLRRSQLTDSCGATSVGTTVLEQMHESGGGILNIRGGDPLLAMEELESILDAATTRPNVAVFVTTPLSVTEVDAARSVASRATLNLVMFGTDSNLTTHQACKEATDRKMELADCLSRSGSRFSITFIGVDNPEDRRAQRRMAYGRWGIRPIFAEVPSDKASLGLLVPSTPAEFSFGESSFRCQEGRCELSTDGRIFVCAGLDAEHGSIATEEPLISILNSNLDAYWSLSKMDMSPCDRCYLRPACVTCAGSADFCDLIGGKYECKAANNVDALPRPYSKGIWIGEISTGQEPRVRPA